MLYFVVTEKARIPLLSFVVVIWADHESPTWGLGLSNFFELFNGLFALRQRKCPSRLSEPGSRLPLHTLQVCIVCRNVKEDDLYAVTDTMSVHSQIAIGQQFQVSYVHGRAPQGAFTVGLWRLPSMICL
ncbi:unnamed protein product, partial [Discosporangium mesarthrocarpum]